MIENAFYGPEFHGEYDVAGVGRLELEEGGTIPDCRLAYTTWGELSPAKDNAVLITTWYSGTHQIWRDVYVGEGHALDPSRYFIVAVDQIGSGLSVSGPLRGRAQLHAAGRPASRRAPVHLRLTRRRGGRPAAHLEEQS